MIFYCPNCQKEVEAKPETTVTTKNQRMAYKAKCPTCGQDMAEFVPEKDKLKMNSQPPASPSVPQPNFEPGTNPPAEMTVLTNPQGAINTALEQIEGKKI